ncbi:MAG: protein kinase, partial [Lachnospiraceae bacterium]|nr:protein kinase [Lachnospiraceae bacterium]
MALLEKTVLFDKYRIIQQLDKTNYVTIYLGEHLHTSEYVLIHIMNPHAITKLESERTRFLNEMKIIRNFEHPSLLRVYDAGEYDDTICIVFEYFDGILLNKYIEQNKTLDIKVALNIAEQIATGLRYAQSFNILHRTLRTPSILILEQDGNILVKLTNFAMTYIIDYSSFANTDIDYSFGFMAPEMTGVLDRPVDQRSDLYSLGIIMYHMMTGCLPFHSDSMDNMVYKHLAVRVKPPEDINPAIPVDVSNIITKLISKDPDLRYSTANELISDIDGFLSNSEFGNRISDNDILHGFNRKAKMYSRHRELTQLKEICDDSFENSGHFIFVHGGLGCGKSDLMNNLYTDLNKRNITALRSSFKSQFRMTPYSAFQQLLNEFAAIYGTYERKHQITEKNRLSQLIGGLTSTVTRISPIMNSVLTEAISLPALDDYKEQQRSFMLLSTFMLSLLRDEKPYCIIFDDLQYADSSSLSLICEMAERISSHKVSIVVTMRDFESPEENPLLASVISRLKNTSGFFDLPLKPFNETRMCEYLSDILNIPRQECSVLTTYMIEKTDGNPYFTINVLRSMLEDGVITVTNRTLEHDWDKLRNVNSEHDVINIIKRRLALLDEDAVTLLEIAAVIGYEFSLDLLSYITDIKLPDMLPWIDHAVSLQFLNYAAARKTLVSFAHKQIYEVFLSMIDSAREKELHYWIAKGIEAKYAGETSQHLYRLVYHFLMADDDRGVRRYCLDAAHLAESSNANEEAISYYRKALELMGHRTANNLDTWIAIKKSLINLNLITGHFNDALSIAEELMPMVEDRLEKAKLYKSIG